MELLDDVCHIESCFGPFADIVSEIPIDTRHQGVLLGASKLISKHMVCSMQTMHLHCIRISTISKLTEPSFHLSLFT